MCVKNSISRKQHWFLSSRNGDILKEYIETENNYYEFTLNDYYKILDMKVITKKEV